MPAFTFEKISPPARRGPAATPEKPKGVLSQMIDRFAEKRARRAVRPKRTPRADEKAAQ
jgi:hypothetical protein